MDKKMGFIASIITIFVFITGITSLNSFIFENINRDTPIEEGDNKGIQEDSDEQEEPGNSEAPKNPPDINESTKYLVDMTPSDGEDSFYIDTQSTEDGLGNTYNTHLTTYLSEFPESDTVNSLIFGLGQKYSKFQGTIFVNSGAPKNSAFRLEVLLDGNRIYTSEIVTKYDPCNIDIDITGGNVIELDFYFEDGSGGMEDGWYKQAIANIADARFVP